MVGGNRKTRHIVINFIATHNLDFLSYPLSKRNFLNEKRREIMASYDALRKISAIRDVGELVTINAARFAKYKKKKLALLSRNKLIKYIPSFLIRTLHDYVTGEQKISHYQQLMLDSWERSGLNKDSAHRVLQRLYGIGPQLFTRLDKDYFSGSPSVLDKRFFHDLSKTNWKKYFSLPHILSPMRLQSALDSGSEDGLTAREKDYVKGIYMTHKKKKWSTFVRSKQGKEYMSQLIKPSSRFYVYDRQHRKAVRLAERDMSIDEIDSPYYGREPDAQTLLDAIEYTRPEPPPACFDWFLNRLGHRIHSYSEASGDDPIFVYSAWMLRNNESPERLTDPQVYWPASDEKHNNFRPSFRTIFPPAAGEWSSGRGNLFYSNEVMMLRVDAIENDDYFSNDTEAAVNFGFEVASKIASVDPTGISSIIVALGEIAWLVVMIIDYLDDDDYIGSYNYTLWPEWMPKQASDYPWSTIPWIILRKDDSVWEFRVKSEVRTAIFI